MSKWFIPCLVILLAVGFFSYWYIHKPKGSTSQPTQSQTFEDCVAAGNPIRETYPPSCTTKDGKTFTQEVGNEVEMQNEITVENPSAGSLVTSPITISGQARGSWFFEGSFPAKILDENGNILGQTPMMAEGEWMTEEFVSFSGTIPFSQTDSATGSLVFSRDNPSGLPENEKELQVPIHFK